MENKDYDYSFHCIPKELEHRQIIDEYLFKSYEQLSHEERVWIKTTLALNETLYTPFLGDTSSSLSHNNSGFQIKKYSKSVSWSILLLDKNYASAPRLAAAIMTTRLAGVQNIIAVWIEKDCTIAPTDIPHTIFTTLELSGIEHSFILNQSELECLISSLKTSGQGRILYFPDKKVSPKTFLPSTIPYWQDSIEPKLLINTKASIDKESLLWAHPNAIIDTIKEPSLSNLQNFDALYCLTEQKHMYKKCLIPRIFTPGFEPYWFHPNLSLAFFTEEVWMISYFNNEKGDIQV